MVIKTIHCIWLGKNMDAFANACVNDWQKQGYNVKVWLENDPLVQKWIEENKFSRECYKRKLYAFITDWLRLKILDEYGGFYIDTDVTLVKDIFKLVKGYDFMTTFENDVSLNSAIMYSVPNSIHLKPLIKFYEDEIWRSNLYIQPMITSKIFEEQFGLIRNNTEQEISGNGKIYTSNCFHSYSGNENYDFNKITDEVYGIHWFKNSWGDSPERNFLRGKNKSFLGKINVYQKYYTNKFFKWIRGKK